MARNGGGTSTQHPINTRKPRPEATALQWHELLATTQHATRELIQWLCAASQEAQAGDGTRSDSSKKEMYEQLATSVLIAGDRGFGKTTVLLSASAAFQQTKHFLELPAGASQKQREEVEALRPLLDQHKKYMVWLPMLDMEPLSEEANMLATLLVRVRDALSTSDTVEPVKRSSALLREEGAEDPSGKIGSLVRNATFMWEGIPAAGLDPRQRSDYQLKSAELYATFRRDFFDAIEEVSRYLAARRGLDKEQGVILVLPIDNVDRSIQHLYLILKLMRMVASRRLWFLLASGRQEFQLFLERTFQGELNESEVGGGPSSASAEDETRSIARRQAAAAMRRVLPRPHRIDIHSLTPEEVWNFKAPRSLVGESADDHPLSSDLKELLLPTLSRHTGEPWSRAHGLKTFADLFDVRERLLAGDGGLLLREYLQSQREETDTEPMSSQGAPTAPTGEAPAPGQEVPLASIDIWKVLEGGQGLLREHLELLRAQVGAKHEEAPVFSYGGRLALGMSARSALDLWQEAREAVLEQQRRGKEPPWSPDGSEPQDLEQLPIRIAYRMLLMAIDESDLPSWASQQLLHRILRFDAQNRIFMDLTGEPVRRFKRTALSDVLGLPSQAPELRSGLHLRRFRDITLEQQDLDRPGRTVLMTPLVSGWFMILQDLLMLTEDRRVMSRRSEPLDITPELLVTRHEALLGNGALSQTGAGAPPGNGRFLGQHTLVDLDFLWLLPTWDTFLDSFIFTMQWKALLHRIQGLLNSDSSALESRADLLGRFILAAWIDNVCAVAGPTRGQWTWSELVQVCPSPEVREDSGQVLDEPGLSRYERAVAWRVEELYARTGRDYIRYGRLRIARDWLEFFLPRLLSPEFLARSIAERMEAALKLDARELVRAWSKHSRLMDARQESLVRGVLERSDDYASLLAAYPQSTDFGVSTCRSWLEAASQSWFDITRGARRP